jgi:hypothetical protein
LASALRSAERRRYRESRALVERAVPESARGLTLAARTQLRLHEPEAALSLARRAVELDARLWRAHLAVADAHLLRRAWQESVLAARTAVRLAPDEYEPHLTLGSALRRRDGASTEARSEIEPARELAGGRLPRPPGTVRRVVLLPVVGLFVVIASLPLFVPDGMRILFQVLRAAALPTALLLLVRFSRRGLSWSAWAARTREANERRYADGDPLAAARAARAVTPWSLLVAWGTAMLSIPAAAWPASVRILPACALGLVVAVAAPAVVRWWFGRRFLREVFLADPVVRVHLVAAGALLGGVVLLSLVSGRERQWFTLLMLALGWCVPGMFGTSWVARRREARVPRAAVPREATGSESSARD